MMTRKNFLPWLTLHPLASVTILYLPGVLGILVYAYFDLRDSDNPVHYTVVTK